MTSPDKTRRANRRAIEPAAPAAPEAPSPDSLEATANLRTPRDPLWAQVRRGILAIIRDEGLEPHAALPSEAELCERFSVSRTVVREAMNQLVHQNVIYKHQGKGAFVAGPREEQNFVSSVRGFSDELLERHHLVTRKVLVQRSGLPDARVQRLLQLPDGDGLDSHVVELRRVLSVEDTPRFLVSIWYPERLVPGLDRVPLESRSLYDVLRRQYGMRFGRADRWVSAALPTPEEARLLGVNTATPLLAIESCAYNTAGTPIECYQGLYRTDAASLHISVQSGGPV